MDEISPDRLYGGVKREPVAQTRAYEPPLTIEEAMRVIELLCEDLTGNACYCGTHLGRATVHIPKGEFVP